MSAVLNTDIRVVIVQPKEIIWFGPPIKLGRKESSLRLHNQVFKKILYLGLYHNGNVSYETLAVLLNST